MKTVFLFPQKFKAIGWVILIPSFFLGLYHMFNSEFELNFLDWQVPWGSIEKDNFTNELIMLLVLGSAMVVAFAKTKEEDEYVQKIRLDSLVWSMYLNYAVLAIGIIGAYSFDFLNVLVLNMYTPLFLFIIRFNYLYSKR